MLERTLVRYLLEVTVFFVGAILSAAASLLDLCFSNAAVTTFVLVTTLVLAVITKHRRVGAGETLSGVTSANVAGSTGILKQRDWRLGGSGKARGFQAQCPNKPVGFTNTSGSCCFFSSGLILLFQCTNIFENLELAAFGCGKRSDGVCCCKTTPCALTVLFDYFVNFNRRAPGDPAKLLLLIRDASFAVGSVEWIHCNPTKLRSATEVLELVLGIIQAHVPEQDSALLSWVWDWREVFIHYSCCSTVVQRNPREKHVLKLLCVHAWCSRCYGLFKQVPNVLI